MRWLACLLLAALPPAALAAGGAEPLVRQAEARGLATHPYWLALLQYARRAPGEPRAAPSEILSEDFFLSPQGRADPAAELAATLTAFFAAPGEAPDEHAQCRFVARFKWLRA